MLRTKVCVVDYGLGNLFSVKNACLWAGMDAIISHSQEDLLQADVVFLPGVGSFGDAMTALRHLDLIGPIKEVASSPKPLVGICLGMQLLMTESYEFGHHQGLGLIEGSVVRLESGFGSNGRVKVPQMGWNRICKRDLESLDTSFPNEVDDDLWSDTPLVGLNDGEHMYFVHSFYVKPDNPEVVRSITRYGNNDFCSSLKYRNIFACQFHPERSGRQGLQIYHNINRHTRLTRTNTND